MLGCRPLQPFIGLGRIDERIEKRLAIVLRERQRLMLCDRTPGSLSERGHTIVGQFAALETGGSFDEVLGVFIYAEAKPFNTSGWIGSASGLSAGHASFSIQQLI